MEYKVVVVNKTESAVFFRQVVEELTAKVNAFIEDGWEPIGGVALVTQTAKLAGDRIVLTQAMINRGTRYDFSAKPRYQKEGAFGDWLQKLKGENA